MSDWLRFMQRRTNELHKAIFGRKKPSLVDALTYFEYHRRLNALGFGRDYSTHPRNPFRREQPSPKLDALAFLRPGFKYSYRIKIRNHWLISSTWTVWHNPKNHQQDGMGCCGPDTPCLNLWRLDLDQIPAFLAGVNIITQRASLSPAKSPRCPD